MNIKKIKYLLTPPIVPKIFEKYFHSGAKAANSITSSENTIEDELRNLREKKINYFFDPEIIEHFCDMMHECFITNKSIPAEDPKNQTKLDELNENGICKIENLFEEKWIKNIHNKILNFCSSREQRIDELVNQYGKRSGRNISESVDGVRVDNELNSGILRAWGVQKIAPDLTDYFQNNPIINDICKSYLGGKTNDSNIYAEYKFKKYWNDPNLKAHADNPFKMVKVFLLLNDLNVKSGCLTFYERSHKFHEWRLIKDFLTVTKYNSKYYSSFTSWRDPELAKINHANPDLISEEKTITGKAGDIIIMDTRGVHGGSLLQEGYRLQLGLVFGMLGDFDIGYMPKRITDLSNNVLQ